MRFGDRHAQESQRHQKIATDLIGDLQRGAEDVACDRLRADHHDHRQQEQAADGLADGIDQACARRRDLNAMNGAVLGQLEMFGHDQRPSAARTCLTAFAASGPFDLAQSSQKLATTFAASS